MNLKNKVVVITGSTKGLGRAMASLFAQEGARVMINSCDKKETEKVGKEIGAVGFAGDVTKEKDMQNLAKFAVKKFGKIDIWINNAGVSVGHQSIFEVNVKRAHQMMEVNFWGTFYGTRLALKHFLKRGEGNLMNIMTIRAFDPSPLSSVYSASKWAIRGLTEVARKVKGKSKIKVFSIYPGSIRTNFWGKHRPEGYENYLTAEEVAQKIIQNLKLTKPKEELVIKRK